MTGRSVIIDTNLLCLLIVGGSGRAAVKKHKRLSTFTYIDFNHLTIILSLFSTIVTSPQIITETSNLLRQSSGELRSMAIENLANFIRIADEKSYPSIQLIEHLAYRSIGIADCALLFASQSSAVILSDDLDLCLQAGRANLPHINYNYFRDGAISLSDIKKSLL